MATVGLRFNANPAHVRTARLVAAAVARQAGVGESVLDEVRLAVGEACTRAIALHQHAAVSYPIQVTLTSNEERFLIEVNDGIPAPAASPVTSLAGGHVHDTGEQDAADAMGLAVIGGLIDDLTIGHSMNGGILRMSWPTAAPADGPQ